MKPYYLLFSLLGLHLCITQAAIINVPADYLTIQDAVNNASPGDEIIVANGTYNESVNINSMGTPGSITIRAENMGMATVNGGIGAAFIASNFSGDILIDGFYLDRNLCPCADDGLIDLQNITNGMVTIQNNSFDPDHGNNSIYIKAEGTTEMNVLVHNNTAAIVLAGDNADFLYAESAGNATLDIVVSDNVVSGLEDDAMSFHIRDAATMNAEVMDNNVSAFSASGSGIEFFAGASGSTGASLDAMVSGNTLSGTTSGDAFHLDIHGNNTTAFLTITGNTISDNDDDGIDMNTQSNAAGAMVQLIIEDNMVMNNGGRGIFVEGETKTTNPSSSYQIRIHGNTVSNSGTSPSIGVKTDDADDNYSLCVDMMDNSSSISVGNAYEIVQDNGSNVTLEQGLSSSMTIATVIGDNNNTGTPINATGTINVVAGACNFIFDEPAIPVYPIALITNDADNDGLGDSLGVKCQIQGIVHGVDQDGSTSLEFFIIDSTGGMGVFNADEFGYAVSEGDELIVIGEVAQFHGLTELTTLDTIMFVSSGNALQVPTLITQPTEATEAEMIKAECFKFVDPSQWLGGAGGSGFDVDITNNVDTFQIRIDDQVDLFSSPIPAGNWFDFIGIGSQFDNTFPHLDGYELLPRYQPDIIALPDPIVGFDQLTDTVMEAGGMHSIALNQAVGNPDITQLTIAVDQTNSTATEGIDFNLLITTIDLVGKGNSSASLDLMIINDGNMEPDETIVLEITMASNNASISNGSISITITDDDAASIELLPPDVIRLYPNPGNAQMVLESSIPMKNISVINMLGQEVIQVNPNRSEAHIQTSTLSAGTYMVRVLTHSGIWVQKWWKE